jgi:peptidoglycan L-alanyl-D-glutamate endopeptidase CwlK
MSFRLSTRSRGRLKGVHPALVRVIEAAIQTSPIDFMVTEGVRTPERQAALVKAGASRTLKSRHLTGHAVDLAAIVDGAVRWDWPLYPSLAVHIKATAVKQGVALVWGGDWPRLRDGPHFELDRKVYP